MGTIYALNLSNSKASASMTEKTIKHTVQIVNENGEEEIVVTSSRAIPGFPEFEESGFAAAFHSWKAPSWKPAKTSTSG
ncbi:MAG: hypothetical protein LBP92_13450 [Deltaproteobacteria bacterium]|jgi:hypothetical protein|nr:hypothetical protein [Deltaproteobacteria bacterium]